MLPNLGRLGRLALDVPHVGPKPTGTATIPLGATTVQGSDTETPAQVIHDEPVMECPICYDAVKLFHPDSYVLACASEHAYHLECLQHANATATPAMRNRCPECKQQLTPSTRVRLEAPVQLPAREGRDAEDVREADDGDGGDDSDDSDDDSDDGNGESEETHVERHRRLFVESRRELAADRRMIQMRDTVGIPIEEGNHPDEDVRLYRPTRAVMQVNVTRQTVRAGDGARDVETVLSRVGLLPAYVVVDEGDGSSLAPRAIYVLPYRPEPLPYLSVPDYVVGPTNRSRAEKFTVHISKLLRLYVAELPALPLPSYLVPSASPNGSRIGLYWTIRRPLNDAERIGLHTIGFPQAVWATPQSAERVVVTEKVARLRDLGIPLVAMANGEFMIRDQVVRAPDRGDREHEFRRMRQHSTWPPYRIPDTFYTYSVFAVVDLGSQEADDPRVATVYYLPYRPTHERESLPIQERFISHYARISRRGSIGSLPDYLQFVPRHLFWTVEGPLPPAAIRELRLAGFPQGVAGSSGAAASRGGSSRAVRQRLSSAPPMPLPSGVGR